MLRCWEAEIPEWRVGADIKWVILPRWGSVVVSEADNYRIETFSVRGVITLPAARNPTRQSVFLFNMAQMPRTTISSVANTLARSAGLTPVDIGGVFSRLKISFDDRERHNATELYLDGEDRTLDNICAHGGYLYYGFEELPMAFSQRFVYVDAAVLLTRDPRDIAVARYQTAEEAARARDKTLDVSVDDYVMSDEALSRVRHACDSYLTPIRHGLHLVQFEPSLRPNHRLDIAAMTEKLVKKLPKYLQNPQRKERRQGILDDVMRKRPTAATVSSHYGHGLHQMLQPETQEALSKALEMQLLYLGYE